MHRLHNYLFVAAVLALVLLAGIQVAAVADHGHHRLLSHPGGLLAGDEPITYLSDNGQAPALLDLGPKLNLTSKKPVIAFDLSGPPTCCIYRYGGSNSTLNGDLPVPATDPRECIRYPLDAHGPKAELIPITDVPEPSTLFASIGLLGGVFGLISRGDRRAISK